MGFRLRGCYPLWRLCSTELRLAHDFVTLAGPCRDRKRRPTTPGRQRLHACTCRVWADPLSLATTRGVSVDFLSSGYLDVSVPPLASAGPMYSGRGNAALPALGFPIREPTGHRLFNASPWLIAVVHALLRLLMPRHPPYTLYILTVICSIRCLNGTARSGENHLH